jgi:hypothetical protein
MSLANIQLAEGVENRPKTEQICEMLSYNLQSKFHPYMSLAKGHNNIRTILNWRAGDKQGWASRT